MTMFLPSTYPSSRRPCRNASMRAELTEGELRPRYPIRGTFPGCCASTKETVSRRTVGSRQTKMLLTMSFDHLIRPREHVGRNRQADLLCRLEIDHQLELRRLLDWQVCGLRTFQDFVH